MIRGSRTPTRGRAGWILGFLAVLCGLLLSGPTSAQTITPEELKRIATAREIVTRIDKEADAQEENFAALLALRDQLDPVRDDLRKLVGVLQQRLSEYAAQLAELGPAPAAGATEPAAQAAERKAKGAVVTEVEGHLRRARALLVEADQLWDQITDARRDLFNDRIFAHEDSFFYVPLWRRVVTDGLPNLQRRLVAKMGEVRRSIDEKDSWPAVIGLGLFMIALLVGLARMQRVLATKSPPIDAEAPSKAAIITRAGFVLATHVLPFVAMAGVVWLAVSRFDIAPEEVQFFMLGVAGAAILYGIGIGAARAAFSPTAAAFRVIRADDATAKRTVRIFNAMLIIYLLGMVALGTIELLSAHLTLTIATTGSVAAAMVATGATMLRGAPPPSSIDDAPGLARLPLNLIRPLFWALGALIIASLVLGFIALAGFVVGRAIATAIIILLAVLVYQAVDVFVRDAATPGSNANSAASRTFGLRPTTIDVAGTVLAGVLRFGTVVFTALLLLSPWGIEFGNLNPFEDVLFGVRFGDIRGRIGAAGIAAILFTVGLVATRLFVAWLDQQLLPRTAISLGVRHSITTIAGYAGFVAAAAVALAQAGVELQNIALVATALSVGIGFGLQQIVSNFVAGLIVLAERPIRVGDVIVVKGEEGKVRRINVRATELSLGENSSVIVPNSEIISSVVKNRSLNDPTQRSTVKLVVDHDSSIDTVFAILLDAAKAHENVLATPAPVTLVSAVTEVGIEVELHMICDSIGKTGTVRSDVYRRVLSRFREEGIRLARSGGDKPAAPLAPPPRKDEA